MESFGRPGLLRWRWPARLRSEAGLLIRSVATRPSGYQSKAMVPPSLLAMLRVTSVLPKPAGFAGAATGGPPRSVQISTTFVSWTGHNTSSLPLAAESAPYLG